MNREIWDEFNYFQNTNEILGNHPIFLEEKIRERVMSLNGLDLVNRLKSLENSMWKDKKQLKSKKNKQTVQKIKLRLKKKEVEKKIIHKRLESIND